MAEKAVLIALADQANVEGRCWPSLPTIARRVCGNEKTVRRALTVLVASHHVTIEQTKGRSSAYLVHPQPRAESPDHPGQRVQGDAGGSPDFPSSTVDTKSGHPGQRVQTPRAESPANHQEPLPSPQEPKKRVSRPEVSLRTYLDQCLTDGRDPIPATAAVFDVAEAKQISPALIALAWSEFKRHHLAGGKSEKTKKKDWQAHFRNAVDANWYRLWWTTPDGAVEMTSPGREAQNMHERLAKQSDRITA